MLGFAAAGSRTRSGKTLSSERLTQSEGVASFLFLHRLPVQRKEEERIMAKSKKSSRKPAVRVKDLSATKNPKGGRKAGKGQQDYLIVKMEDVLITG